MKRRARPCWRHRFPPEIIAARCVNYQVVGEDEADPGRGKISDVAPIATLLIGAAEGDVVAMLDGEAEVVGGAVGYRPPAPETALARPLPTPLPKAA